MLLPSDLFYYVASPVSRQDEPNHVLSGQDGATLPARDYPLCPARKKFPEGQILDPLLTKRFQSRWLDISLVVVVFFFASLWTSTLSWSVHKHVKKDQYPAILTSCLVIYQYVLCSV